MFLAAWNCTETGATFALKELLGEKPASAKDRSATTETSLPTKSSIYYKNLKHCGNFFNEIFQNLLQRTTRLRLFPMRPSTITLMKIQNFCRQHWSSLWRSKQDFMIRWQLSCHDSSKKMKMINSTHHWWQHSHDPPSEEVCWSKVQMQMFSSVLVETMMKLHVNRFHKIPSRNTKPTWLQDTLIWSAIRVQILARTKCPVWFEPLWVLCSTPTLRFSP